MMVSGTLKAVVLCLLAIGFQGPVVKVGQCALFREPGNVKDILDLLERLGTSGIKDKVLEKVQDGVQGYLKTTGIPGEKVEKNIGDLFKKAPELRKNLLKDPSKLGKYTELAESDVDAVFNALVKWIPVLHSELYYLFFQTDEDGWSLGGGAWTEHPLSGGLNKGDLSRWLTTPFSTVPYIPKGFGKKTVHDENNGSHLPDHIGIDLFTGGPLNHAQYGLMFLTPIWHPSNLASAVLFLREYCDMVNGDKFGDHIPADNRDDLVYICEVLSADLTALTSVLHPLYRDSTVMNPYKGHLKAEAFVHYTQWLQINLTKIIETLEKMLEECAKWTKDSLGKATLAGPFKYGFTFKDRDWQTKSFEEKLKGPVTKLTSESGSLTRLSLGSSASTFVQPTNVKDVLDLFGKLSEMEVANKVAQKVQQKVKLYLKPIGVTGTDVQWNLEDVVDNIPELREILLKDPEEYGKYSDLTDYHVNVCVSALIKWIPILHSELYYLFFQTDDGASKIHGGAWREHPLKGATDKMDLHQWLTSKGFTPEELNEGSLGSHIAPLTGISLHLADRMSHAQYGLFLVSPTWHDSNLGSAVLFLQEFCRQVNEGDGIFKDKHTDKKYTKLKSVCKEFHKQITTLSEHIWPLYRPAPLKKAKKKSDEDETDLLKNPYTGTFLAGAFPKYVDWLGKNLDGLKESLDKLVTESKRWKKKEIATSASSGPFMFGLVFTDKWNGKSNTGKLKNPIKKMVKGKGSVTQLSEELKKLIETSEEL